MRSRRNIIGIIVCILMLAGLCAWRFWPTSAKQLPDVAEMPSPAPSASITPSPAPTPAAALTTPEDLTPEEAAFVVDVSKETTAERISGRETAWIKYSHSEFDERSLAETGNPYAVSLGFIGKSSQDIYDEAIEEGYRSPVWGDMTIRGLADIEVGRYTIGQLNPKLLEFIEKNDQAHADKSGSSAAGNGYWLEEKDGSIHVTKEYQEYFAVAEELLDLFNNQGVKTKQPVKNFYLDREPKDRYRRTELNPEQPNEKVLLLQKKASSTINVEVGFRLSDKGFEIFESKKSPSYGPPSNIPEPDPEEIEIIEIPPTPTPTPSPIPQPSPNPEPTPEVEEGKDDRFDPVNQGNADIGGGKNDDPTAGPYEPPGTVHKPDDLPPEDSQSNDGHDVNNVDGPERPPVVETPITENPGIGSHYGEGDDVVDTSGGNDKVTESVDDPF